MEVLILFIQSLIITIVIWGLLAFIFRNAKKDEEEINTWLIEKLIKQL